MAIIDIPKQGIDTLRHLPVAERTKRLLGKVATIYSERLGTPQGSHALDESNYPHAAERYIKEADLKVQPTNPQTYHERQATVQQLQQVEPIANDPKYLYTHPDQQFVHVPFNKEK